MKNIILNLLKTEVKPAMGCTEPVAVALAFAKAREAGNHENIDSIKLVVCPNFYKNGLSVGIPHSNLVGLDMASAIGAVGGNSEDGLKILEGINEKIVKTAEEIVNNKKVKIEIKPTDEKIYIEAIIESEKGKSIAVIRNKHTDFYLVKNNDEILFEKEYLESDSKVEENPFFNLTIREIIREVESINYKDFDFLLAGIDMNEKISNEGLNRKLGMGVGYSIKNNIEKGILSEDLPTKAMYMTAAAADARMSGITMPVMSSNGSGNNGITAILPIVAYSKMHDIDSERLIKALALSHLINCYIKNFIGRLSAICSCGVSAGTGSSAAITWLMGGTYEQIEGAINNMIGNISGLICDGAKNGCALKLATAASIGAHSSILAFNDSIISPRDGIVGRTVEESIRNLGVVGEKGMRVTDLVILDVMRNME